jgi:hypothetical protein
MLRTVTALASFVRGSLLLFLASATAAGCAPTETGNPSAQVAIAPQTYDVMGLGPMISVSELVLGGARIDLVHGTSQGGACDLVEPLVDVESYEPFTRRGERVELATSLPIDTYCAAEGEIYASDRLEGLVLSIDAIRLVDGAAVRIRAYGDAIPLDLGLRDGFAITEAGLAMHFVVDVEVIVNTVPELTTLRAMDGVVRVDETNAPEVLATVLERVRTSVTVLEDLDRDRVVDEEDRAAVIAGPPTGPIRSGD